MPANCRWRSPAPARCPRASGAASLRPECGPWGGPTRTARSAHRSSPGPLGVLGAPLRGPGLAEILQEQAQRFDLELHRPVAGEQQIELVRPVETDGQQREELARLGAVDVAGADRGDAVDAQTAVDPLVAARRIGEAGIDRPAFG